MMGAIVGDMIGSVYNQHNIRTKDFPLFRENCFFTGNTVILYLFFLSLHKT